MLSRLATFLFAHGRRVLFGAVIGVTLLLRRQRDEHEENASRRARDVAFAQTSDAVRVFSLALVVPTTAFGFYIVMHGHLSPGGGFQGGVVLAAGPLALLLAGRYLALKSLAPDWAAEAADAIGAGGYALLGLGGLVFASVYLKNFLPLGMPAHLLSAGFMPLNSIAVGLEVAGGFLVIWTQFLDQSLITRRDAGG